jgi:hypothetical protein
MGCDAVEDGATLEGRQRGLDGMDASVNGGFGKGGVLDPALDPALDAGLEKQGPENAGPVLDFLLDHEGVLEERGGPGVVAIQLGLVTQGEFGVIPLEPVHHLDLLGLGETFAGAVRAALQPANIREIRKGPTVPTGKRAPGTGRLKQFLQQAPGFVQTPDPAQRKAFVRLDHKGIRRCEG